MQLHPHGDPTAAPPERLPLALALFTALEEAGAAHNPDWLQKLLGVPAGDVPATPQAALAALPAWQAAAQQQAQRLFPHRLYAR